MFTLAVWSRVVQSRDVRCRVFSRPISRPICSGKLIVGLPEKNTLYDKNKLPQQEYDIQTVRCLSQFCDLLRMLSETICSHSRQ